MKKLLLIITILIISAGQGLRAQKKIDFKWSQFSDLKNSANEEKQIQVRFFKNIEFGGFVFYLGHFGGQMEHNEAINNSGIPWKDWYAYGISLYQEYREYSNHPALNRAMPLILRLPGGNLIRLLAQVDDFPNAKIPEEMHPSQYLAFSPQKDPEDAYKMASQFLKDLNELYQAINFDEYYVNKLPLYKATHQMVSDMLPRGAFLSTMEDFYQKSFSSYNLLPSLTIPSGMGFGPTYELESGKHIFNIFGPFGRQSFAKAEAIDMGFSDSTHLRELSTHEFGHSFVGPRMDNFPREWIDQTEVLFGDIRQAMSNQAYTKWFTCVEEHFVRAGEVVIAQLLGNTEDAEKLKKNYINDRQFIYLPMIIEQLEAYTKDSKATYDSYCVKAMQALIQKAKKEE